MNSKKFNVQDLAMVGILSALVFAGSWIQINIPTSIDNTRLHLGNVMCLLAGLLMGPLYGGLAAGIGSMFFDFTNPLYISSAPFTFIFKFAMAFFCGLIARYGQKRGKAFAFSWVGATTGALTYVALYLGKSYITDTFFKRLEIQTVLISLSTKAVTSTINGILAVLISVPLSVALAKGLQRANIRYFAKKD